jgi:hypothetical protein
MQKSWSGSFIEQIVRKHLLCMGTILDNWHNSEKNRKIPGILGSNPNGEPVRSTGCHLQVHET